MKRIINTILFLFAAVTLMAQNSFVVADKNGNSQLVQSLIFQQDAANGLFSWGTSADGYQPERDIRNLQYIVRAKNELVTGSTDEVAAILEDLSGTDDADAAAVAAALQTNPNVEEATSEDGNNVVVKMNDEEGLAFYPLYELEPLFSDDDLTLDYLPQFTPPVMAPSLTVPLGKVAIFNFFYDQSGYNRQNQIVDRIDAWFTDHGYFVDRYGKSGKPEFTLENLRNVVQEMQSPYKFIIIMTHGAIYHGTPYIATHEVVNKNKDHYPNPADGKNYRMVCLGDEIGILGPGQLVYVGACDSAPNGGYPQLDDNLFPNYNQTELIGWSGKTRIAQAHAALMFYYMLYGHYTCARTLNHLPSSDGKGQISFSKRLAQSMGNMIIDVNPDRVFDYDSNITASCEKVTCVNQSKMAFRISMNNLPHYPYTIKINVIDLRLNIKDTYEKKIYNEMNSTGILCSMKDNLSDGIYAVEILTEDGKVAKLDYPCGFIKSASFKELGAEVVSDADITEPVILDADGQSVEEITISAGSSKTFTIEGYSGHTFNALCLKPEIVEVSVSGTNGTTLTVTGVSEGIAYFAAYDEQNRQLAVAKVTVTAGGGQSYTSCPDDNHPHMIDLGLPSGTKWACCNVGATAPEGYGDYFAWGETQSKDEYSWANYIHCDGSQETCHDIGSDIAGTEYDAATANWGAPWRLPSKAQCEELRDNCTSQWMTQNGINGRTFTGSNGGVIFLPAAGYRWDSSLNDDGSDGDFWSSTLNESGSDSAYGLGFYSGYVYWGYGSRGYGLSVRPVRQN